MEIKQYTWDIVDSNSWLIEEGNHGLLIDAVDNAELYREIQRLDDLTIILTHAHFDHIIGLNKIREEHHHTSVISTMKCSEYLGNVFRNMSATANAFLEFYDGEIKRKIEPFTCEHADNIFEEKCEIGWHGYKILLEALHVHSADSLMVIFDGKYLFSGDSLLSIPTITRFPTGSSKLFCEEDIPRLKEMYYIREVFPGHGQSGNIKEMIEINQNIMKRE